MNKEITDPKLLKYMKKVGSMKSVTKPDLTKLRDAYHKPHPSIELNFDGVKEKPQAELVFTTYKCNKCESQFNHTQAKAAAGIMPACPKCDE